MANRRLPHPIESDEPDQQATRRTSGPTIEKQAEESNQRNRRRAGRIRPLSELTPITVRAHGTVS